MGLTLCQDKGQRNKSIRALYTVALGERHQGITELEALVQEGIELVALKVVLGDAEVLARCPLPPEGIEQVVEMLKAAIQDKKWVARETGFLLATSSSWFSGKRKKPGF